LIVYNAGSLLAVHLPSNQRQHHLQTCHYCNCCLSCCAAAGEALGSLALIATSTATGQAAIRSILPMPLCLLAVLAAMSCMALLLPLVTSQSNMLALACLALVMGLNDVGTSMSGECQGATLPER
jgi:hypothetical protein